MSTTTPVAVDEMMAVVKAAVDAYDPTIEVRWPGVEKQSPPAGDIRWMRVSYAHDDSDQASLAGADGARRWRRQGQLFVQCFAPLAAGGLPVASEMACVIRDAFEGKATTSGVWFRRATTNEVGPSASWYQVNASSTFEYDTVR